MADKTDDLVIGVSTDMSSVQRALRKLDADIARAAGTVGRSFEAAGIKIDRSITAIQDKINRVTGVARESGREWTGALANQGRAMDELRAKFDPVFAAAQRYRAELGELNTAYNLGAIGADVYSARLTDLAAKHDSAVAAAQRLKAEYAQMAASERLAATSADGQSMWNAYAGVGAGSGKSAQASAAALVAELERMERIAAQKAAQIGQSFADELESRLVPGTKKAAHDSASVFAAELDRLETIARQKAQQAGANFQSALNASFGIGSARNSASASAAVFEELDRKATALRATLNPLAAAQSLYNAELAEYASLAARGAISTDELAAAQGLAKQRLDATTAALNKQKAAAPNRMNTANIAAQFQDIGVTTAMGMSPIQIALQQGTQLSAVLESMKGTGQSTGATLKAAFTSIISPMSLATIAAIGIGTAIAQYVAKAIPATKTLDDVLKQHAENIERLSPAYKKALKDAQKYASENPIVVARLFELDEKQARGALDKQIRAALANAKTRMPSLAVDILSNFDFFNDSRFGQGIVDSLSKVSAQFKEFAPLIAQLEAGRISIVEFREQVILLGDADPGLRKRADELLGFTDAASSAALEVAGMSKALSPLEEAFANLSGAIERVKTDSVRKEIEALEDRAKKGKLSVAEVEYALHRLSGTDPDLSAASSSLFDLFKQALAAKAAIDALAGPIGGGTIAGGKQGRLGAMERAAEDAKRALEMWRRFGHDEDAGLDPGRRKKEPKAKIPKKTADDRFFEDIEAIRQRTLALAEERAQLGLSYEAQVRRKTAFDLEQKALKDVREAARQKGDQDWQNAQLTPDQIRRIDEVSAAYARQAEELRKAQDQLSFQKDLLRGALGDLNSALSDGKLEWEELGQIALNVLDKITNKLLDDVVDAIFQVNRASSGGGGGGILGFLGSLFGGGRNVFPAAPLLGGGGGLWADGGYTGAGGKYEPAGVVHRGEYVFSQDAVNRIGVGNLEAMHRNLRGFANGGFVGPKMPRIHAPANNNGSTYAPVYNIDARGADSGVESKIIDAIKTYDRGRKARLAEDIPDLRKRGAI